jgi:cytolysin-activating lysine-acyltransferase
MLCKIKIKGFEFYDVPGRIYSRNIHGKFWGIFGGYSRGQNLNYELVKTCEFEKGLASPLSPRRPVDLGIFQATSRTASLPAQQPAQQTAQPDNIAVLGHVLWLMSQSAVHKHVFVADFEWLVMPAVLHGQYRIWRDKNEQGHLVPIAYVSWAFLDDDAETRLKSGIKRLRPTDWKSGPNAWLIDIIAPFGGTEKALQELKQSVHKDHPLKSLQPSPTGGMAVVEV